MKRSGVFLLVGAARKPPRRALMGRKEFWTHLVQFDQFVSWRVFAVSEGGEVRKKGRGGRQTRLDGNTGWCAKEEEEEEEEGRIKRDQKFSTPCTS